MDVSWAVRVCRESLLIIVLVDVVAPGCCCWSVMTPAPTVQLWRSIVVAVVSVVLVVVVVSTLICPENVL